MYVLVLPRFILQTSRMFPVTLHQLLGRDKVFLRSIYSQHANLRGPAMLHALRELGYTPYHMIEALQNPKRDFPLWTEALNANFYDKSERWGREEFDRLFGKYDASLDVPTCLFWDDLHKVYPEAKIILTNRDVDKWMTSMQATVFKVQWSWTSRLLSYIDRDFWGPMKTCLDLCFKIFCGNDHGERCRQAYLDHCERVRRTIPRERLLEFNLGDGWEPLCKFLDKPVPDTPYPRINDPKSFEGIVKDCMKRAVWGLCKRFMAYSLPVAVVGVAVWYKFRL